MIIQLKTVPNVFTFWFLIHKTVNETLSYCSKFIIIRGLFYRSPAQVGCMRQVLGPGALARPRGIWWRGRWEGGSGWGIHVTPWLIHVNVWQNPLKCCEVIGLQLIKINEKKKKKNQASKCNTQKKKIKKQNKTKKVCFNTMSGY